MPNRIWSFLHRQYYSRLQIPAFNRYTALRDGFAGTERHILISGTTRGGTTWLAELLYQPDQCLIWEPLLYEHLQATTGDFASALGIIPYIPETAEWPEARQFFDALLSGRDQSFYTLKSHAEANRNLFQTRRLMIKFCRANLLLPWLTRHYRLKPVFLIRHPLAVVASQLRHPGFARLDIHQHIFRIQQPRYNDIFERFRAQTERIDSLESLLANWWAIQQVLALEHPQRHERWLTVSYEQLFLQPENEMERIAQWTGDPIPAKWQSRVKKPSQTAGSPNPGIDNWRSQFSREQVRRILDIVQAYGLTMYTDEAVPDPGALYR